MSRVVLFPQDENSTKRLVFENQCFAIEDYMMISKFGENGSKLVDPIMRNIGGDPRSDIAFAVASLKREGVAVMVGGGKIKVQILPKLFDKNAPQDYDRYYLIETQDILGNYQKFIADNDEMSEIIANIAVQ